MNQQKKKLATKTELKAGQDKIVKLQTYDQRSIDQSYFVNDGTQLYLILQLLYYTLKKLAILKELYHEDLKVCQTKAYYSYH